MKRVVRKFIPVMILLLGIKNQVATAATGVGNGGDTVDRFLGLARSVLVETLVRIQDRTNTDKLCSTNVNLTESQKAFCREFIFSALPQILKLNRTAPVTPFSLTSFRLFVEDPFGNTRQVSAMTPLGVEGEIVFSREVVRLLSPRNLMSLMTHEFGHKVTLKSQGTPISDNQPVGPFDFPGGGRVLLDSVGEALAQAAVEKRLIGDSFGISDFFECRLQHMGTDLEFSSSGFSTRFFFQAQDYDAYETHIGYFPQDLRCEIQDRVSGDRLSLQMTIHEEAGCQFELDGKRWTKMSIFNVEKDSGTQTLLKEELYDAYNPMCSNDFDNVNLPVYTEVDWHGKKYKFEVSYLNSVGRSSFAGFSPNSYKKFK
jgi:hypothetical protein